MGTDGLWCPLWLVMSNIWNRTPTLGKQAAKPVPWQVTWPWGTTSLSWLPPLMHCDREVVRWGSRNEAKNQDDLAQRAGEVKLGRRSIAMPGRYPVPHDPCGQHPAVLGGNTLNVLNRLRDEGLLTSRTRSSVKDTASKTD